jgi:delta 1-pyrroline-5-carboxylate dehydrogenase
LAALEFAGSDDPARLAHHARRTGDTEAILRLAPAAARAAGAAHQQALEQWEAAVEAGAGEEALEGVAVKAYLSGWPERGIDARRRLAALHADDRRVAAEFTDAFVARTRSLTQGSALDYSTDVGSLVSAAQLTRVQAHVDDAVAKGATILTGGKARPDLGPFFFEPTVLSGVTPEMACFAQETFGPVVAITVVDSEDEAIAAANASEFGLNASVFSGSIAHGRRVADRIDAGSVNINEGYRASFSSTDAPMGGMKQSGVGRRNGPEGLLRFVDARTVAESTGLLTLPRTGAEFAAMSGLMITLLKTMKALRLR